MKKSLHALFCTICALFFIPVSVQAGEYWINLGDTALSAVMPVVPGNSTYTSVVQEIYFASELRAAGASSTGGNITAITFRYGGKSGTTAVSAQTRGVQIFLNKIDASVDGFDINSSDYKLYFKAPGSKVFEGQLKTRAIDAGKTDTAQIVLNAPFAWNGTDNILLTVYDTTNTGFSDANLRFVLTAPTSDNTARFVHIHQIQARASSDFSTYRPSNLAGQKGEIFSKSVSVEGQIASHKWVNKVLFTIVTPVPVPTSPSAGSITASSATLSWTAAAGADSYEVRYGTTSGSLGAATNVGNVTSYSLSELTDETTYYYQIRTKKGSEYSAWTDEASFTTSALAAHTHNEITFDKWAETSSIPTSGNKYLANDVQFDIYANDVTLTGDLNLCLNGHTLDAFAYRIIVPSGVTFTLFDNEGGGKITSGYASTYGVVTVESGGTFILQEGNIENTASANDGSNAIYNGGTLQIKGAPVISGATADISLGNSAKIVLAGAITNSAPYTVYKALTGDFTTGWNDYMGDADPWEYFVASNPSQGVYRNGDEANMITSLNLTGSNSSNSSTISSHDGYVAYFTLSGRTIASAQYNTLCLPFALNNAQLEAAFGSGYDLRAFVGSEMIDEEMVLTFSEKQSALIAGQPYLIQPSGEDVVNPKFERITIDATNRDQTSDTYISFKGVYSPTELTGGNKNLLFLGADNELLWPATTANIKGFRAYFEVKPSAGAAKRARIVKKEEGATGIESQMVNGKCENGKFIKDGQLLIIRDGKQYNVLGIRL